MKRLRYISRPTPALAQSGIVQPQDPVGLFKWWLLQKLTEIFGGVTNL